MPDQAMQLNRARLRELTDLYFSEGELRTVCFDQGVDYENLAGTNKVEKIVSLIVQAERTGLLTKLLDELKQMRSNAPWDSIYIPAPVHPASPPPVVVPQPSVPPPTLPQILVGRWRIQIAAPNPYWSAQADFTLIENGYIGGSLATSFGMGVVQGNWYIDPQGDLVYQTQGMIGLQPTFYVRAVRFNQVSPDYLTGMTNNQENMAWQRIT